MSSITRRCTARHWRRGFVTSRPYNLRSYAAVAESRLDLLAVDAKWQQRWAEAAKDPSMRRAPEKGKSYVLPMFPYPSGALHLGHLRVYTISDVLARAKHMQGHEVIHPMGWDAFGLPAENAAIERGIDPAEWTKQNIAMMKKQLKAMGGMWDWTREFMTCDPKFYKHTQRIFLLLHERGLAYQADSLVNYDPVDKTVLANEQVDANGISWRSGAKVEKKQLKQWFLRITEYKKDLLQDLDLLKECNRWPERVLSMQKHWLGKSTGAKIRFSTKVNTLDGIRSRLIEVFTTRPDTLFGVQYLALSTKHPLVQELSQTSTELQAFLESMSNIPQGSREGYLLDNVKAFNPLGKLGMLPDDADLPVYVAPYVLADYGEGAVMGVPGHDVRDFEFFLQHQPGRSIPLVIRGSSIETSKAPFLNYQRGDLPFTDEGVLTSHCGPFAGQFSTVAARAIVERLKGQVIQYYDRKWNSAEFVDSWRLRDWLISRQRYWGTPIPIIHCQHCGVVPVRIEDLPVTLPKLDGGWLKGKGGSPLEDAHEWLNTKCPSCGGDAKRDTDTMDTFVDSSWYYMRFADPDNVDAPLSAAAADSHLPVDIYVGGVEHATLHLLYARFISKFLATITSLWPSGGGPANQGEPFKQLITQGMVHGKTYTDAATGRFLKPAEVDLTDPRVPVLLATHEAVNVSFEKMSKSKYNGVEPSACIAKHGADATRAHMLFQAPVSDVLEWDEQPIVGIQRWFGRVWRVVNEAKNTDIINHKSPPLADFSSSEAELWINVQQTISNSIEILNKTYALNVLISDLIKLTNSLFSVHPSLGAANGTPSSAKNARLVCPAIYYHATSALLRLMAPVTPAFAEECWEHLHSHFRPINIDTPATNTTQSHAPDSIFNHPLPLPDNSLAILQDRQTSPVAVQINGKLRFVVNTPRLAPELLEGDGKELEEYMWKLIEKSEEYRAWSHRAANQEKKRLERIVVARGGRTVNLVFK